MLMLVLRVLGGKFRSVEYQKNILSIPGLSCFREIEASCYYFLIVYYYHFVVGDLMGGVDKGGNSSISKKCRTGVALSPLTSVEDDPNIDPTLLRIYQSFCDWCGGETVGLN